MIPEIMPKMYELGYADAYWGFGCKHPDDKMYMLGYARGEDDLDNT